MHVCRCLKQQHYITYTCTVRHSINKSMLLELEDLKAPKIQQQQPETFFFTKLSSNGFLN